jgi:hypothetical protein
MLRGRPAGFRVANHLLIPQPAILSEYTGEQPGLQGRQSFLTGNFNIS